MSRISRMTLNRRRYAAAAQLAVVLLVALMLTGCGKKGIPAPPPGEPNTYPQPYPKN
jgi:predicted small lipoprotein YifL